MKATDRIGRLRAEGCQVFVKRERPVQDSSNGWNGAEVTAFRLKTTVRPQDPKATFAPRGGRTRVSIIAPNGFRAEGESACSVLDNFRKAHGLNMALGRAISQLEAHRGEVGAAMLEPVAEEVA